MNPINIFKALILLCTMLKGLYLYMCICECVCENCVYVKSACVYLCKKCVYLWVGVLA
jgi:hypothetical protein